MCVCPSNHLLFSIFLTVGLSPYKTQLSIQITIEKLLGSQILMLDIMYVQENHHGILVPFICRHPSIWRILQSDHYFNCLKKNTDLLHFFIIQSSKKFYSYFVYIFYHSVRRYEILRVVFS